MKKIEIDEPYTPTAKLIWYYLFARTLQGKGAATRKEIMTDLNLDASICRTAINLLRSKKTIVSDVMFRADDEPDLKILAGD